jgi:hypothetical protein
LPFESPQLLRRFRSVRYLVQLIEQQQLGFDR